MVEHSEPRAADFNVTVDAAGSISNITVTNAGAGYTGSTTEIKFSAPKAIGVGIGTTATATANIAANGTITSATITNPGLGYTSTNAPNVITEIPTAKFETISEVSNVQGFSGIITGISVKLLELVVKRRLSSTSLDSKIMVEVENQKLLLMS